MFRTQAMSTMLSLACIKEQGLSLTLLQLTRLFAQPVLVAFNSRSPFPTFRVRLSSPTPTRRFLSLLRHSWVDLACLALSSVVVADRPRSWILSSSRSPVREAFFHCSGIAIRHGRSHCDISKVGFGQIIDCLCNPGDCTSRCRTLDSFIRIELPDKFGVNA